MPYRLAIFETHPIQYKVPWFRALAAHPDIDLTVFYCMIPDARQQGAGFGVDFHWDIPLLEGYRYVVLENVAKRPGVTHFLGCDTPSIADHIGGRAEGGKPRAEGRSGAPNPTRAASAAADHPSRVQSQAPGPTTPPSCGPRLSGFPPEADPPSVDIPHPLPFDAVIVNGWVVKSCLQALWACRRAGVPAILRCEACDLQPRAWWKTLLHRALLHQFSAFIAIGKANREFYLKRGVPAERIVDGFYCVENERFAGSCPRNAPARSACVKGASTDAAGGRSALRQKWGIPEGAVCFLFCGKFAAKKRPLDTLHALQRLQNAGVPVSPCESVNDQANGLQDDGTADHCSRTPGRPDAPTHASSHPRSGSELWPQDGRRTDAPTHGHTNPRAPLALLMVGDGELRADCEAFAREHCLPVTFAGFLNQCEMPGAYAAADCLVLPSDHGETWGLVVNEAMACGLPAIVSDRVGCHPDLVIEGQTGHVFPCGDAAALAQVMRQSAADPERLATMGRSAQEHVQRYSISGLVGGTLAALRLVSRT